MPHKLITIMCDKVTVKIAVMPFLCLLSIKLYPQKTITIEEVNNIVLLKSNRIKIIQNDLLSGELASSLFKASLLPKVTLSANLPYQRSITEVIQSDGSQRFIERNNVNSALNLNISQLVPFTGGSLSISSSLNNARDFNNDITNFSSNWANISYQQTINGFNSHKWNKKINDLNILKNAANFLKEKIKLKYDVSKLYLDTQLLQLKSTLIKENINKTEKIIVEIEEKFKYGRTIKTEVEQAKIALEQLKRRLRANNINYELGIKSLKNVMGQDIGDFILTPVHQEDYLLDEEDLRSKMLKNQFDLDKEIRILEMDSNMDKVKKEGAVSVSLQLGMGLNSSANNFENLYDTPAQSQFITINTKIPVLDWGKSKKSYQLARLEKEKLELSLKEEEININEQVDELISYKASLLDQMKSLEEQQRLSKNIIGMYEELLQLGRKTMVEYKTQLIESFDIAVEYQKTVNNLYLLKLKIDEINLTL